MYKTAVPKTEKKIIKWWNKKYITSVNKSYDEATFSTGYLSIYDPVLHSIHIRPFGTDHLMQPAHWKYPSRGPDN